MHDVRCYVWERCMHEVSSIRAAARHQLLGMDGDTHGFVRE